jgi:leucyl aminopeptidase
LQATRKDIPLSAAEIIIDGASPDEIADGIACAEVTVRAAAVARDLTNTPSAHLTATNLGEIAEQLGADNGFTVEVFDRDAIIGLGCGGLLGVNAGSVEEPRIIKLSYPGTGDGLNVAVVGKGIMYDSGGISLKPSDPMHLLMKMDMGGAAAILGMFTALTDRQVTARVTAWLMCTDNMPSGSAYKLGDVLTARGGKTVEVKNTDAEGRLVLMDGLTLAVETHPDVIIDIATLTGAALMALGPLTAALFSNTPNLADRVRAAAEHTGEQVWEMPLETGYRRQLDSQIADLSNLGGKYAGATTAALFLQEFVDGIPWAHLDIAGTMQSDNDESWRSAGATGYGARLLLELTASLLPSPAGTARSGADR